MYHPLRSRSTATLIASVVLSTTTITLMCNVSCAWAEDVIAATVNGEPIRKADLRRSIDRSIDTSRITAENLDRLLAAVLERLVQQRLVQSYLDRKRLSASHAEVDLKIKQLLRELKDRKKTLQDYLTLRGQSQAELRREMRWQMSWRRHVEKHVTTDVLKKYFTQHARDYDGTRLQVSQILLQPKKSDDPSEIKTLVNKAELLRTQILGKKLSFADAAKEHSDAPSRAQGGDQGMITRHGEYGETFSKAAFALDLDQISQPIVTSFGVHLIQCTKVKPGKKTWADVSEALRRAATTELFQKRAQAERPKAEIKYTGAVPYLDGSSGRVVGHR